MRVFRGPLTGHGHDHVNETLAARSHGLQVFNSHAVFCFKVGDDGFDNFDVFGWERLTNEVAQ